jgi:hypothetical protein
MRRSRPRDKRSRRHPKSRDEGFRKKRRSTKRRTERDHQKSTEVHKSTEPRWQSTIDLSLGRRRSNELQEWGMTMSKMRLTNKYTSPPGGSLLRHAPSCLCNKVLPTSRKPIGRQSTETRTEKSTKSTKILLKLPIKSATMKSTGWSPKRTSNHDYLVKQHLRVNATTGCRIYSTEHAEALHEGSEERKCT